ncbi:MAG: hypothetical protein NZ837_02680 [Gammaproteobacteria bacterium]|nr:hypothetical protein [Gammaproteobacteria bacterium]
MTAIGSRSPCVDADSAHHHKLDVGSAAPPHMTERRFRMSFQIPSGVPHDGYLKLPTPSGDYQLLRFGFPGWQRTVGWLINWKVRGEVSGAGL